MITSELLKRLAPLTPSRLRDRFIEPLNRYLPEYKIDSYLRVCCFLATFGVESDFFKVLTEYATGAAYEGRKDLGNIHPGDGEKFKGRGGFQTTGRGNYERLNETVGKKLDIDFIKNPEKLAEVNVAIESACIFWQDNHLSKYADTGDFRNLSSVVNCGRPFHTPNQWAKRNELYSLCKRNVQRDFSFSALVPLVNIQLTSADVAPADNQPVAVTPTEPEPSAVKTFSDKYLKHCPQDTAKNVVLVITGRISAWATTLWQVGFHGKVLCFLIAFGAIVPVVYAFVYYRTRITGWAKDIFDSLTTDNA